MGSAGSGSSGRTVLTFPVVDRIAIFVGIPVVALFLGALLPAVARWMLGWDTGLPLRPVIRFVGAVDSPREIVINLAIWLLVGLGVTRTAMAESAKVTLADSEVRLDKDNRTLTVARATVAAVFLDGKTLVVLDRESRQVFRDSPRASGAALAEAFRAYGYPWLDADPYADLYRSWVPGTPDLPPAVNAVLSAREIALRRKAGDEARELLEAVEKLGFVVRDEGTRQYWRSLVRS